jgi:hypothetical protein
MTRPRWIERRRTSPATHRRTQIEQRSSNTSCAGAERGGPAGREVGADDVEPRWCAKLTGERTEAMAARDTTLARALANMAGTRSPTPRQSSGVAHREGGSRLTARLRGEHASTFHAQDIGW